MVSTKQNVQKTIKVDRKLLQRLLNAITAGRTVEMVNIVKHDLSPTTLSLAKPGGVMNSTTKAELYNILVAGLRTPSEVPQAELKTCVLIDGHALIQALGKPDGSDGCQTFGDYAEVFKQTVTHHTELMWYLTAILGMPQSKQ